MLTEAQRHTIANAKQDGHRWRVDIRTPGWRGLTSRGLAYGRADAGRMPGALGLLTPTGEQERERIYAEAEAAIRAAEAEGDAGPHEEAEDWRDWSAIEADGPVPPRDNRCY